MLDVYCGNVIIDRFPLIIKRRHDSSIRDVIDIEFTVGIRFPVRHWNISFQSELKNCRSLALPLRQVTVACLWGKDTRS
jgi:hypothetical protein